MNKIEKMYEYIGIGKKVMCKWTCKDSPDCNANCEHYESTQLYYPPFTPEKQIEILKLLCQRRFIEFGTTPDSEYFLYDHDCCQSYSKYFEEAVSEFVRILWPDLTEEEQEQIRRILNE